MIAPAAMMMMASSSWECDNSSLPPLACWRRLRALLLDLPVPSEAPLSSSEFVCDFSFSLLISFEASSSLMLLVAVVMVAVMNRI